MKLKPEQIEEWRELLANKFGSYIRYLLNAHIEELVTALNEAIEKTKLEAKHKTLNAGMIGHKARILPGSAFAGETGVIRAIIPENDVYQIDLSSGKGVHFFEHEFVVIGDQVSSDSKPVNSGMIGHTVRVKSGNVYAGAIGTVYDRAQEIGEYKVHLRSGVRMAFFEHDLEVIEGKVISEPKSEAAAPETEVTKDPLIGKKVITIPSNKPAVVVRREEHYGDDYYILEIENYGKAMLRRAEFKLPDEQPTEPDWTSTPPTEPGHYWCKREQHAVVVSVVVNDGIRIGCYYGLWAPLADNFWKDTEWWPVPFKVPVTSTK